MSTASWLPVVVAGVVAWIIGALWYSPVLFAKAWVRAHGFTPERLEAMRARAGMAYGGSLVAFIVIAAVLKLFLNHLGADSLQDGVMWGFHAWLGFALPMGFIAYIYADKAIATFLIDAGYQLVYLVTMGAILGAWT
jgi:hypothetical protein